MKSLSEMNFDWGGVNAPRYDGWMNTATATPTAAPPTTPSSGSTGVPAAPPTAPASGAPPVASPATGAPTTSPTSGTDPNAANLEVIRKSHETVQRLGGQEKVSTAVERYNKMYDTSKDLATQLGYTPESFEEAFGDAPAEIYNHLVTEARKLQDTNRRQEGEVPDAVRKYLDKHVSPLKNVLQQQMADSANRLSDNEFNSQLQAHSLFKDKNVPAPVREKIYDLFIEKASADTKAQQAILKSGDVSGLKVHFDSAVADYFAMVNEHNKWQGITVPPTTGNNGNQRSATTAASTGSNPFSLDDIIEGNDNATKGIAALRNFR